MDGERKFLGPGCPLVVVLSLLRTELLGGVAMEMRPWCGALSLLPIPPSQLQPESRALLFPPSLYKRPHPLTPLGPAGLPGVSPGFPGVCACACVHVHV